MAQLLYEVSQKTPLKFKSALPVAKAVPLSISAINMFKMGNCFVKASCFRSTLVSQGVGRSNYIVTNRVGRREKVGETHHYSHFILAHG